MPAVGHHQLLPAFLDEACGRIDGHLADVVGIHTGQHVDGIDHVFGGRRRPKLEHVEEFRRVAAQGGVALADVVQKVEILWLGELLRLTDALGEGVPGDDRLDGRERIAAALLGFEQGLADAPVRAHLLKTKVFDKSCQTVHTVHGIKAFAFWKIVLEILFSIDYCFNEF